MKSEDLQKLTASEPLTLEEEYDMQKSWCEDDDSECKLYIVNYFHHFFTILIIAYEFLIFRMHFYHLR